MYGHDLTFMAFSAVIIVPLCLWIYYFLITKSNVTGLILKRSDETTVLFFSRLAGLVIFGVLPFAILALPSGLTFSEAGLTTGRLKDHKILLFLTMSVMILLSLYVSGNRSLRNRLIKPGLKEIKVSEVILTGSGWVFYLLGYEFMFRGILWSLCIKAFGLWPALLINIALYSFAHLPQGRVSFLGSLPAGLIFCLGTYISESFLFAFIIHCSISVSYEFFTALQSVRYRNIETTKRNFI
jgi:membrane protease YdiL (CAAX protease family)